MIRHLIDSADWSIEEIEKLWSISRELKAGKVLPKIDTCFDKKTVVLSFNKESTRSRLTFHKAIVEMGGVPIFIGKDDLHNKSIENILDLSRAMAVSSSAICIRLLPDNTLKYGMGEKVLREIAAETSCYSVPVISMSHDRCHPCQGLYEMLTIQDSLNRKNLAGTKISYCWVKGQQARPWSPTQDSIMLATRLGMDVTLCNPPEFNLDFDVINICKKNSIKSGGSFSVINKFDNAFSNQEIIYARHWANDEQQKYNNKYLDWYLDENNLTNSYFIHPMPLRRGDEISSSVADGPKSLLAQLVKNKYYLQKAVLAMSIGYE